MKIHETLFPEVFLIEPKLFSDHRGFFYESFRYDKLADLGIEFNPMQDNHSYNYHKNTLRGIHLQISEYAQAKIVRCTQGEIIDFVVDLRIESPNFGKYMKFILSPENKFQLFIPRGFGHAYVTMKDNTEVLYKTDNYYSRDHELVLVWNDINLSIDWEINEAPILSDKDAAGITIEEYIKVLSN